MTEITDLDLTNWIDCWNCDDGYVASCFEEFACVDPEGGCEDCMRKCDVCKGKGGWDRRRSRQEPRP